MIKYWWFVVVFTILSSIYGTIVYWIACPYYYNLRACGHTLQTEISIKLTFIIVNCIAPSNIRQTVDLAVAAIVLDIISDTLSK